MRSLWFASLLLASLPAHADNGKVHYDAGGMPRCIESKTDYHEGLLFVWDESDHYQRDVRAVPFDEISLNTGDQAFLSCNNWQFLANRAGIAGQTLPNDASELGGYDITPEMQNAFAQVRIGGTVFHEEKSAAEYLAKHPMETFTREENRALAAKYGMGFTGDIYANFVAGSHPNNKIFSDLVNQKIAARDPHDLSTKLKGVTVVFSTGYMQSSVNDRLRPLINDFKSEGVNVSVLSMDSMAGMQTNSDTIAAQLRTALSAGQKLILVGGSKGVTDMIGALSEVALDKQSYPGKVIGVVSLSGLSEGSFLVDWAVKFPTYLLVKEIIKMEAKNLKLPLTTYDGLNDMSTERMESFYPKKLYVLPHDIKYFSLIGVPGGDGTVRDSDIAALQKSITRPHISGEGANDGYVEFPGTSVPRYSGLNVYELTFNASHVILDGYYQSYDMQKDADRQQVIHAIFGAVADLLAQ